MKVFKKLKDVLFDIEEEEEIPVITKEDKAEEISPIKEVKMPDEEEDFEDLKPIRFKKEVEEIKEEPKKEPFNFPLDDFEDEVPLRSKRDYFDEEFVSRSYTKEEPVRKKDEYDYSRLSSFEEKKKEEVKNFKPSPVISPVYGILDQNYTKDDVIVKSDSNNKKISPNLDDVRKKAYGTKKDTVKEEIKEAYEDEFAEPLKTLDEILIDKEDEVIEPVIKEDAKEKVEVFDDELPDEPYADEVKEEEKEDALESDLFNLIDSMYEERNEREEEND